MPWYKNVENQLTGIALGDQQSLGPRGVHNIVSSKVPSFHITAISSALTSSLLVCCVIGGGIRSGQPVTHQGTLCSESVVVDEQVRYHRADALGGT